MNMSTQSYEQLVAGANLIRTNELPESNTHTLVGEQLLQMVNKQQEADDSSRSEIYNVSRYHVNTDGTPIFTLAQAIAMVPARLRVGGTMIKFQSSTGELIAYFNGSAISSWSNVAEWRVFISDKDFQLAEKSDNKNQPNGYPGLDAGGKLFKSQLPDTYQLSSEKGRANGYPALDNSGTIPDAQIPNTVERTSKKNQPNGYPGLNSTGKLLASQLPDNFQPTSEKGRANGYPGLDNSGTIPDAQIPNTVERTSKKNQANGYAGLNSTGKLLASQLPDNYQPSSEKGRANGYPALDNSGTIPDAQIPNTVERVENKNKANGYAGLDADGMLDNRQVRKAFGYRLDTIDDQISIQHNSLLNFGTNDFTIEVLIRISEGGAYPTNQYIFNKTSTKYINIAIVNNQILSLSLYDGITNYGVGVGKIFFIGKYYHIVVTIKNNIPYLYIDGELMGIGKDRSGVSFDNSARFLINGVSGSRLNGSVSLLRIFKKGFDQSQVNYYYNDGRPDLSRLSYYDKLDKLTTGCVLELLPENATESKWLDTQNGLDGTTSGNPAINYGNVVPDAYIYPSRKFIGLESSGDASAFSTISIEVNKSSRIYINGGVFVESDGTLIGDSIYLYKNNRKTAYVKLTESSGYIYGDYLYHFSISTVPVNAPNFYVNMPSMPASFSTGQTEVKFFGTMQNLPRDLYNLGVQKFKVGGNFVSGKFEELPRDLKYLFLSDASISGNAKYLPKLLSAFIYNTDNKFTCLVSELPASLNILEVSGSGLVSGDIGQTKARFGNFIIQSTNANITYSTGIKVATNFNTFRIKPVAGVFTSAMTDQLLIDLAAQITFFIGSKTIDLTGNCGAPTAASSTARATLSGLGATVLTN